MPTMEGTVAEAQPPAAQPGAEQLLFGSGDRPWAQVATGLNVAGFYPFAAEPGAPTDTFKPGVFEKAPPRSGYLLGGVAVEAAGVIRADSLPGETETRSRYERFLGGVALFASAERATGTASPTVHRSSLDLLRDAAQGDKESRDALLVDTKTHVAEVVGGVGERIVVRLKLGGRGPEWSGQNDEARQFYSLTSYDHSPQLLAVRHAEGIGSFRLTDRNAEGQLKGRAVYDFSAMARASQQELSAAGYFLNSIGLCMRRNTFDDQELTIASLFVAGVDQRNFKPQKGETEAQEVARQSAALDARFDVKVLRKLYALFGVEGAEHMEPDELLATQLITSEEFDELDMAMLYDQLATEEMEEEAQTFFGSVEMWQQIGSPQHITREHYEAHIRASQQRQAAHEELCESIVDEQIRRQHEANTPLEAAELKRRVVLDMLVDRAIDEGDIDAGRMGNEAAASANAARASYAAGDKDGGDRHRTQAKQKARDSSCPPGERNKKGAGDENKKEDEPEDHCNEVKDGDAVHCPFCDKNVRAIVPQKGGRIYCSNRTCTAALYKENLQEKLFDKRQNNEPKQPFLRPFNTSSKSNDNKKVDKP